MNCDLEDSDAALLLLFPRLACPSSLRWVDVLELCSEKLFVLEPDAKGALQSVMETELVEKVFVIAFDD